MNKFFSNTTWIIGGKIAQMLIGAFVSIFMARYLGPKNLGELSYTISFVTFMASVASLGINNIIVKELVTKRDSEGEILGTSLCLRLVASILSIIVIVIILTFLNPNEPTLLLLTFVQSISLIFDSFELFRYWFQSKLESKTVAILSFIAYILTTIFKVWLIVASKSIVYFGWIVTLESFLLAVLIYGQYYKSKNHKLSFSISRAKKLFSHSYHFILSGLMITSYTQMDKIMIGKLIGNTDVGYYSIAIGIGSMWVFILVAIIDSATPIIMSKYKDNRSLFTRNLKRLYAAIFWVSIFISIIITIIAPFIVNILYGNEFYNSIAVLRFTTWIVGISHLSIATNIWYVMENKQNYIKYILMISVICNLVLNYLLISNFGVIGAALATIITNVLIVFIVPLLFKDIRSNVKNILEAILFIKVI